MFEKTRNFHRNQLARQVPIATQREVRWSFYAPQQVDGIGGNVKRFVRQKNIASNLLFEIQHQKKGRKLIERIAGLHILLDVE
jgi:hypothetical protein